MSQLLLYWEWTVFLLYAVTTALHGVLQHRYAKEYHTKPQPQKTDAHTNKVGVILATYNDQPHIIRQILQSLVDQTYKGPIRVYMVDDCSTKDREKRKLLCSEFPKVTFIWATKNEKKRVAQNHAIEQAVHEECEFILFGDCDSPYNREAIAALVAEMDDPRVGGVCGRVAVANAKKNWLTRLLAIRYRLMFERERAALDRFGAIWNASGPIAFYRTKLLVQVWPQYQQQMFKGIRCVTADDVCLTNRILQLGYLIRYCKQAIAYTHVPETLWAYLKQQLRWNRDKFRDQWEILHSAKRRGAYPVFDMLMRTYFPFCLFLPSMFVAAHLLSGQNTALDGWGLLGMVFVQGINTLVATKSLRFTLGYGLIHALLLVPLRLLSFSTRGNSSWVTR